MKLPWDWRDDAEYLIWRRQISKIRFTKEERAMIARIVLANPDDPEALQSVVGLIGKFHGIKPPEPTPEQYETWRRNSLERFRE